MDRLTTKERRRIAKVYGTPGPLVRSFAPTGRSQHVIYVVQLFEHPDVVKIGRTTNWNGRRKSYATWNLSAGDAIARERALVITEEFVDLPRLEEALLTSLHHPRRHGREWLVADFDEVVRHVEMFLCEHALTFL